MKTIGLLGGMSWHSTAEYYRQINDSVQKKLGGWHSAKIIVVSVDFDEIDVEHATKDYRKSDSIIIQAAQKLESAGSDFIIICANTPHKLADMISSNVKIPIVHIADATADQIIVRNIKKVALLGTKHTMEEEFYRGRLEKFGLSVIIPEKDEREIIAQAINNECQGKNNDESKIKIIGIIEELAKRGAEGVILGCTELPLIVNQKDTQVVLFDTMKIHAEKAVDLAIGDVGIDK
jgi:aspartate racemase